MYMRRQIVVLIGFALACTILGAKAGRCAAAEVEALAGEPYGVGRFKVSLPDGHFWADATVNLVERRSKVLYPVTTGLATTLPVLDHPSGRPTVLEVYFLFRNESKLDLTLNAAGKTFTASAVPRHDAEAHGKLATRWWSAYAAAARRRAQKDVYPLCVDNST